MDDLNPEISGERIVWQAVGGIDAGTDAEIFTWTPGTGIQQITQNDWKDGWAQVSGDRIAWWGGWYSDIYTWTPTTGVTSITSGTGNNYVGPRVSGDRVVWNGYGAGGGPDPEIFTWTPTGGVQQLTSDDVNDMEPQVSGDRIVWYATGGIDGGTDREIFSWTPTSDVQQLTNNLTDELRPSVWDDRVAWEGSGGTDGGDDTEIFMWDAATSTSQQLAANALYDSLARVSGDRVVWHGFDGANWQVFTWAPSGGAQQLTSSLSYGLALETSARVWGDRVVWQGTVVGDSEVFAAAITRGSDDGFRTVHAQYEGAAGLFSTSDSIFLDTAAPIVAIAGPSPGETLTAASIGIAGTATDGLGSGVSSVEVSVRRSDGTFWSASEWTTTQAWLTAVDTTTWNLDWAPADNGTYTYTISVRAKDTAGNTSLARSVSGLWVDNTP